MAQSPGGGQVAVIRVRSLQVRQLHLDAVHLATQLVDFLGGRIQFHPQTRSGFVNQVDGLIGQLASRDIAVRQLRGSHQGAVRNRHLVVSLVLRGNTAQNRHGILDRRFTHIDLLETALQSGILFDVFAILVQSRGAYQTQLSARQHGLEHIRGIHRPTVSSRTHHRVQLVDKSNYLPFGGFDFFQHRLEAFLELAAVLGPGHHRGQVQGNQMLVFQGIRDVSGHDTLGQALYHGSFSHPGFTDQNRVILGASAQYLDYAANLLVTPNHRVQLPVHGALRQVVTVLLQGFESGLGVRRSHLRSAAGFLYGFAQFFG